MQATADIFTLLRPLTDLLTLREEKGRLDNLTIGLCGDLKNGRTVHSLVKAMSCYKNNKFVFISTESLKLPSYIKDVLAVNGSEYKEVSNLEDAIGELDVLYMTRIQREDLRQSRIINVKRTFMFLTALKCLRQSVI